MGRGCSIRVVVAKSPKTAAEHGVEMLPIVCRHKIEGDGIDARVGVSKTKSDNLKRVPEKVVFFPGFRIEKEPNKK